MTRFAAVFCAISLLYLSAKTGDAIGSGCTNGCYSDTKWNSGGQDYRLSAGTICLTINTNQGTQLCPARTNEGGTCGTYLGVTWAITESCRCCSSFGGTDKGQQHEQIGKTTCTAGDFDNGGNQLTKCGS